MRITNSMTTNKMMLNINRNMTKVDRLYEQISTGKKINFPSEEPITASRALKFRSSIQETETYIKNTAGAVSWMESTEQAFSNNTDMLKTIRDLVTKGASDQFNFSDRKALVTQLESLFDQMGLEMNASYSGRYVFSGFKTDKPPIIMEDIPNADYTIDQVLTAGGVQEGKVYKNLAVGEEPEVIEVLKLKLPYSNLENLTLTKSDNQTNPATVTSFPVTIVSKLDPLAYKDQATGPQYIKETGELIIDATTYSEMTNDTQNTFSINYNKKTLLKGDLNPEIYFHCFNNNEADLVTNVPPREYFVDGNIDQNGNVVSQKIEYEFGTNTRIDINSMAKDCYTDTLYGELKNLVYVVNNVEVSKTEVLKEKYSNPPYSLQNEELEKAINDQVSQEQQKYRGVIQSAFSDSLEKIDNQYDQMAKEYTDLGSRMNKMQSIENRLEESKLSYYTLMSKNEDIDYLETTMNLNTAKYVYQSSLKVGGDIMQTSLVDFIR